MKLSQLVLGFETVYNLLLISCKLVLVLARSWECSCESNFCSFVLAFSGYHYYELLVSGGKEFVQY